MLFPVLLYLFIFVISTIFTFIEYSSDTDDVVGSGTWTYRQLVFANLSADRYGFGKSVWNIFGTV